MRRSDMNQNEALRPRGRCSVWGCEEPIFAEALCVNHLNLPPRALGPDSMNPSVHKAKRTGRLPFGRTTAGPTQSNPQRPTYSARRSDSILTYSDNGMPTSSLTRQFPNYEGPNHIPEHPASLVPTNSMVPRQKRATTQYLPANASVVMGETLPSEPQEPYFELNTDIPPPMQIHPASVRQGHHQVSLESRHVPPNPNAAPRRNLALIGGLVDVDVGFTSNLNLSFTQSSTVPPGSSGASLKTPPGAISSAQVANAKLEESLSITVARTPSWRKPDLVSSNRRETPASHVYEKPDQIFQIKENLPLHISPTKRKADSSDTQPRIKGPPIGLRPERRPTFSESESQTRSQNSNQQEDSYQGALSGKSSKWHSDEQTASRLRNSKMVQASNIPTPAIEVIHAKTRRQLENHTHVQVEIVGNDGRQKSFQMSDCPQQPKLQTNGPKDGEYRVDVPSSTPKKDVSAVIDTMLEATQDTAEKHKKTEARVFDSEAFDAMIYRQSSMHPPQGVSVQIPARPKTPVQKPSVEDGRQYLAINPAIHYPYARSEEWYKHKTLEIQARGGRKAWFGKVIERQRWLRAKEKAEEDERNAARLADRIPARKDPQPWSYNRIIDFGDVPPENLPQDVLQNAAWAKACAWHRENQAKRVLRDRAARDANRKAWDQAERIMEDAKIASKRNREPLKR